MTTRFTISSDLIVEAMQSDTTRAALAARADAIAGRAEQIAANEGVDAQIEREDGTRPKGRPYSRVSADASQEWGNRYSERLRILGRAAEGQ